MSKLLIKAKNPFKRMIIGKLKEADQHNTKMDQAARRGDKKTAETHKKKRDKISSLFQKPKKLSKAKGPKALTGRQHFSKWLSHHKQARRAKPDSWARTKHVGHANMHLDEAQKHPDFDKWLDSYQKRVRKKK